MTWGRVQERQIAVGNRVTVKGRGQGVVVEVLPKALDWLNHWRVPYRVQLASGTEFIAHPDNVRLLETIDT